MFDNKYLLELPFIEDLQTLLYLLYFAKKNYMKKLITIFLGLSFFISANAQTKTLKELKTDSMGTKAIQYLADHKADSLYNITGSKFQEKIAKEDFQNICENQLYAINDFKHVTFVKTIEGINKYKVEGSPELQLLVGLDAEFKIETLLIQPYAED